MEIQINRNIDKIVVDRITIFVDDKEFEILVNKLGELIIMKEQYGDDESSLIIKPKVSNVIGII